MLSRPVSDYNNCIVHLCQPEPSGRPHKATNNWGIGNGSELADYQLGRFYLSDATAREHRPYSLRVYLFWELLVDALFLALGVIHGAIVMPLVIQLSLQLRITSTNPTRKIKAAGVRISLYIILLFIAHPCLYIVGHWNLTQAQSTDDQLGRIQSGILGFFGLFRPLDR